MYAMIDVKPLPVGFPDLISRAVAKSRKSIPVIRASLSIRSISLSWQSEAAPMISKGYPTSEGPYFSTFCTKFQVEAAARL